MKIRMHQAPTIDKQKSRGDTYSVPLGVNTGLSASLRGSASTSRGRPLRFIDDLVRDPDGISSHCAS